MGGYDYKALLERSKEDYERRTAPTVNGTGDEGKGRAAENTDTKVRTAVKEDPAPDSEELPSAKNRGRKAGRKATAKKDETEGGKLMIHISLPEDDYWGIKMMAMEKRTSLSQMVLTWYRKERKRESN